MDLRVVGRAVPGEPEPARPPGWDGGAQSGIKEKQCTSCSQESVRARVALFPACVLKTLSPAGHLRDYLITLNTPPLPPTTEGTPAVTPDTCSSSNTRRSRHKAVGGGRNPRLGFIQRRVKDSSPFRPQR